MDKFKNCETFKTGLYKPHTIKAGLINISIVYGEKECYTKDMVFYAMATDKDGNHYEIYTNKKGVLAFPVLPDEIPGIYPYL